MLQRWGCHFAFNALKLLSTNSAQRWNHYKALGLTPSASTAEVKAAYYKLSKLYHPDRNNGSEASARKFRDIVAAYEVLGKTDSRRKYDREMIKKYETRNVDMASRKKGNKRNKKNTHSTRIKANHFKNEGRGKPKHKTGGLKNIRKNNRENFETYIIQAIPLFVACLMCCKKR